MRVILFLDYYVAGILSVFSELDVGLGSLVKSLVLLLNHAEIFLHVGSIALASCYDRPKVVSLTVIAAYFCLGIVKLTVQNVCEGAVRAAALGVFDVLDSFAVIALENIEDSDIGLSSVGA